MKIGVIGVGNMGGAILKGLANRFEKKELYAENPVNPRVSRLSQEVGFNLVNRPADLPTDLDVLIVTVPAHLTTQILSQLTVSKQTIIASAAGGVRISDVASAVDGRPVVALIPNIPVAVNAGTIGLAYDGDITEGQQKVVKDVLAQLGDVLEVKEAQLPIIGTIGGCGPAFVDVFMDAMGDAAVENGLGRDLANQTISSMVKGSGQLAYQTKMTPSDLKDQVTSPGGTTIKGVNQLSSYDFRKAIIEAVNAANGNM